MVWPFTRRAASTSAAAKDPNERCVALQLESGGKPAVWMINAALDDCPERSSLTWHLQFYIEMRDIVEPIRFPTEEEQAALTALRSELEATLKADDNARFLGSITEDGIRTLLYRVRNAELANAYLAGVVSDPSAERAMQYVMQPDTEWRLAEPYLGAVRASSHSSVPRGRLERRDGNVVVVNE